MLAQRIQSSTEVYSKRTGPHLGLQRERDFCEGTNDNRRSDTPACADLNRAAASRQRSMLLDLNLLCAYANFTDNPQFR